MARVDLQEFHKKASAVHEAFLASQTEPLRDALSNLNKWHSLHSDRIAEFETQVAKLKKHTQKAPDASYTKLAVNNFQRRVVSMSFLESYAISCVYIFLIFPRHSECATLKIDRITVNTENAGGRVCRGV